VRHYTLYMTLTSAGGTVLSANWDHFIVVPNARRFNPPEGISPAPRFSLDLALTHMGVPVTGKVEIQDKYIPANRYEAKLDGAGRASLTGLLPGAYRLEAGAKSYEFLLNSDDKLSVDFRPGLQTTLGVKPIIEWKALPRPAKTYN
jgi:hypothetical protein